MSAIYSVFLNNPSNTRLKLITDFVSLAYTRSVNVAGTMALVLGNNYDRRLFTKDSRLEVWRDIKGRSYLETGAQWFVHQIEFDQDSQQLIIKAKSALTLLERKVIAFKSGTSQATKTGLADDIIVEFVSENLGSGATDFDGIVNRDWSAYIDILSSPGNGATIHKTASLRNLLKIIQEIAQDSATLGTAVFFDLIYNPSSKKLEFQTFTGQRSLDHTSGQNQVTLSPDFGTLSEVRRNDDYNNEVTYVYAAGQGESIDRVIKSASDSTRIGLSPFGAIEQVIDARNTKDADKLTAEAQAGVRAGRPKRTFQAELINRPGSQYGIHWNWGDIVKAEIDGEVLSARLDTIQVSVSQGKETIKASIRVED